MKTNTGTLNVIRQQSKLSCRMTNYILPISRRPRRPCTTICLVMIRYYESMTGNHQQKSCISNAAQDENFLSGYVAKYWWNRGPYANNLSSADSHDIPGGSRSEKQGIRTLAKETKIGAHNKLWYSFIPKTAVVCYSSMNRNEALL